MNQQMNSNLPSLPAANIFQLVVAGNYQRVKRFWEFMKTSPAYRLTKDFRMLFDNSDQKRDMHIVLQVEETPCYQKREVTKVQIRDQAGQHILFTLLDVQMVEMSDGMMYIRGKNFDIFADPMQDQGKAARSDTEEEHPKWR